MGVTGFTVPMQATHVMMPTKVARRWHEGCRKLRVPSEGRRSSRDSPFLQSGNNGLGKRLNGAA
jgi:hypothetical protein